MEALSTNPYNLDQLRMMGGKNKKFVKTMIRIFLEQVSSTLEDINVSYDKKNYTQICNLAHKIKPSLDMMMIHPLSTEVHELEKIAREGKNEARMEFIIQRMNTVLYLVSKELRKELGYAKKV